MAEAAERLRIAPQTVYRWCRAGRLRAIKIGKEWRIPEDQLGSGRQPLGLVPLPDLLSRLAGESEHLLGLAIDKLTLAQLEATFFEAGAAGGARLVHGRWDEEEAAVRTRLRPAVRGAPGGEPDLVLHELRAAYEAKQGNGVGELYLREIDAAAGEGQPCFIYGSPYVYFGYHLARLAEFEASVGQHLLGQPALALCGYAMNDLLELYGAQVLTHVMELVARHTGAICFDGQRALLTRLGGAAR